MVVVVCRLVLYRYSIGLTSFCEQLVRDWFSYQFGVVSSLYHCLLSFFVLFLFLSGSCHDICRDVRVSARAARAAKPCFLSFR